MENASLGVLFSHGTFAAHFFTRTFLQYLKWTYPEPFYLGHFWVWVRFLAHTPEKYSLYRWVPPFYVPEILGDCLFYFRLGCLLKKTEVWASNPCSYSFSHGQRVSGLHLELLHRQPGFKRCENSKHLQNRDGTSAEQMINAIMSILWMNLLLFVEMNVPQKFQWQFQCFIKTNSTSFQLD